MAISRNKRRQIAKLRAANAACDKANTAAVLERKAIVAANMARPAKRESSHGLVTSYGMLTRPIAKRQLRYTKGAANGGTSGGLPVA